MTPFLWCLLALPVCLLALEMFFRKTPVSPQGCLVLCMVSAAIGLTGMAIVAITMPAMFQVRGNEPIEPVIVTSVIALVNALCYEVIGLGGTSEFRREMRDWFRFRGILRASA